MKRLDDNKKLLEILLKIVEDNPDLRLNQILLSYDFVDPYDDFYTEPGKILKRVKKRIKQYEDNRRDD